VSSVPITCGRARRLLWPDAGPRAASPEVIEAQQHLEACRACQTFGRDMLALRGAIHDAAPREHAPPDVRGRLFSAIARARTGVEESPSHRRRRAQWLTAAVVLLIGLAGSLTVGRLPRHAPADSITAIAEEHAKALGETHVASADPEEIARWLAGQVHFAIHVPVLPGAELRGARLYVAGGRRGAVVEYDVGAVAVSYFVVPDGTEGTDHSAPVRFEGTKRAGYHVVAWREPGLLHAMVGDLPESRLAMLAKACVDQARRSVAWLPIRVDPDEKG
jgi:anti-sigma factor RsiW